MEQTPAYKLTELLVRFVQDLRRIDLPSAIAALDDLEPLAAATGDVRDGMDDIMKAIDRDARGIRDAYAAIRDHKIVRT
jgi:hypothetical protein